MSKVDLKKISKFVVEMGGARWSCLPSTYHNAVAKSILDTIRKQTGRVFHSTQPDTFTGLAIPAFSDTAINVGYGVTIMGQSPKSNSGIVFDDGKEGMANVAEFFRECGDYKIHPSLFPGICVGPNEIIDAILTAMDIFPKFYKDLHFNYNAMWAYTLRHAKYNKWDISMKEILQKRRQIRRYHPFSVLQFLKYCAINKSVGLYRNFLKKNTKLSPFFDSIPDNISDFVKQLSDYQKSYNGNN